MKLTKRKKLFIWVGAIAVVLALLFSVGAIYVNDYYKADADAIEASFPAELTERAEKGYITVGDKSNQNGFIFYPGGKVEYTAYLPLMRLLAKEGIFCVLVEMPLNLAVLDPNAAEDIVKKYPEIKSWYIGGHSLGGSMAASCASKNTNVFSGLVLLGSYSTADLSDTSLEVLSLYGSLDQVMNREKYEKYRSNLPESFTERIIEGGNHAGFGMYGEQDGDGKATLTEEEQITHTAALITELIKK